MNAATPTTHRNPQDRLRDNTRTCSAVRLYPVAQAAEVLSVSKDYVYDRIKEGAIPVVELGTGRAKQRIRADDLQTFIDTRTYGRA